MDQRSTYYFSMFTDKRALIIDRDLRTCEILCTALRIEGLDASFSVTVSDALQRLNSRHYDVVIANEGVGGEGHTGLLSRIGEAEGVRGAILVLIQDAPDVQRAVDAVKFGVSEVFVKPFDIERLLQAIKRDISAAPVRAVHVRIPGVSKLTHRERDVLELITNGQSNKEAGKQLGISPRTIEVHRARVMEKLGAKNTADLIRMVLVGQSVSFGER